MDGKQALDKIIAIAKDERKYRNVLITNGLVKESDILAARDCGVRLGMLQRMACAFNLTDYDGFWELVTKE